MKPTPLLRSIAAYTALALGTMVTCKYGGKVDLKDIDREHGTHFSQVDDLSNANGNIDTVEALKYIKSFDGDNNRSLSNEELQLCRREVDHLNSHSWFHRNIAESKRSIDGILSDLEIIPEHLRPALH